MDLFLMRHGIAVDQADEGAADGDRPLSPKGVKRMRKIAKGLLALKISFDQILTSPLPRARQTADIIAEALGLDGQVQDLPSLAPDGSAKEIVSSLASYSDEKRVLLVGHQPLLGKTTSLLLTGGNGVELRLKKGGMCCIEVDDVKADRRSSVRWMLTPKQLRLLAGGRKS